MKSSLISGQSGSTCLNSPMDIDRHGGTDMEIRISIIGERNKMSISGSNLQGQPQKTHFSMRILEQQCSSCYLEDGLRISRFCDTSRKRKPCVNEMLHNKEICVRFVQKHLVSEAYSLFHPKDIRAHLTYNLRSLRCSRFQQNLRHALFSSDTRVTQSYSPACKYSERQGHREGVEWGFDCTKTSLVRSQSWRTIVIRSLKEGISPSA